MKNVVTHQGNTRIIEIGKPGRGWTVYINPEYIDAVYQNANGQMEYNLRPGTLIHNDVTARELRAIIKEQCAG